jgi:hypothetical protein
MPIPLIPLIDDEAIAPEDVADGVAIVIPGISIVL